MAPRRRARALVLGLLADLPRKNCWTIAEHAGQARPDGLQRFVNSYNHDFPPDWDRLGTQAKARAWLRQKGLVGPDVRVSAADAARLRKLREAIRALAIANHGGRPDPVATATIRGASHTARLRVAVDAGRTVLEPDRPGVDGAVATLLGILREAQLTGCGRG